jgi:hypothetical protein
VQMHQNGLGRALAVPVLMPMMSICARMRAMCATAVLMLVEAEAGVGLWLSAFWGSWCILRQTREMSHVDGTGGWARLCIYLKVLQAGCRSNFSLVLQRMEGPSGENR